MKPLFCLLSLLLPVVTAPLQAQTPPQPTPGHEKLAASVGRWDVTIEMVGEDGKPMLSKGASTIRLLTGGLWLIESFSSTFNGIAFEGHGTTGFDPSRGKYTIHWIDAWTPTLLMLEGEYDKSGDVLTVTGTGVGMDGKPAKYRNVTSWKNKDEFVFQMFVTGADGKEVQGLTMTYKRQRLGPAK